jgi:hypothetical protein
MASTEGRSGPDRPITKFQQSKIWALAKKLDLDSEKLHLLVPRGSISALTFREAFDLIEYLARLDAGSREDSTRGGAQNSSGATQEQRNFIYFLFGRVGWLENPARMKGFLRRYARVESVEEIRDRKRASAIIEALKAIHARMKNGVSS